MCSVHKNVDFFLPHVMTGEMLMSTLERFLWGYCRQTRTFATCVHQVFCRPSTGLSRPSGPKTAKKSQKNLPGPSSPESQKSPAKVGKVPEKSPKSVISGTCLPFRDFLETPGRKAQEDFFVTFSRFSARTASRLL